MERLDMQVAAPWRRALDVHWMFGDDRRRCLRDRVAGTVVVDVGQAR